MPLPLEGVKVVDLTSALSGPYCTMMLGDMGAEVIKIELPGTGDDSRRWGPPFVKGESAYFFTVNRNKKSITVNLKTAGGREILRRLAERSDVLVQNYAPGKLDKLGFPYSLLREINSRLIYCAISGFGQTGPRSKKPGYDLILEGMGGVMSLTGPVDGLPYKVGVPVADILGGIFGSYAILAGLFQRTQTGEGQMIDASMLAGQVALLGYQAGRYLSTGEVPPPYGRFHDILFPYGTFKTGAGYINLAVGNDTQFHRLCEAIGLDELPSDPRFLTNPDRVTHRPALQEILEERFSRYTKEELLELLEVASVPSGPIYDLKEVFDDPQAKHMRLERTVTHPTAGDIKLAGFPFELSSSSLEVRLPPPLLGQHTEEVLSSLGYTGADIDALRKDEAI